MASGPGAVPEEALIAGDSKFDIAAGRNAGVTTVAVTYGYREKPYLAEAAHATAEFRDLPAVLDRISSKLI